MTQKYHRRIRLPGWDYRTAGFNFLTICTFQRECLFTNPRLKVWQRGYWERIIRNERELNATRQYIRHNLLRWAEDRDNLDRLLAKMRYVEGA